MIRRAAVVGLGRLGLPIAACLAAAGVEVRGADVDARAIERLRAGQCPLYETGLEEKLSAGRERLTFTTDTAEATRDVDASFVVVPTPSTEDGSFSLRFVLEACEQIAVALRESERFSTVVITSTVSPTSTDGPIRRALEASSGKRAGVDFGLCYSPEFIALGSVIEDFLRPDFVLVGQSDEVSGGDLAEMYGRVCETDPPIFRMSNVNAEIAKIAVNTFVTTKIAFANMLSEICEQVDGGDIDAVTGALGLDERIGPAYLRGGLSYGGPCFPRDNRALAAFARSVGVEPALPEATDAANLAHARRITERIRSLSSPDDTVAVLGLSYKPWTDVAEKAAGIDIANGLASAGLKVVAYDPVAREGARRSLESSVRVVESLGDSVGLANVVVVATPWPQIVNAIADELERATSVRVVVDCWRVLDVEQVPSGIDLVRLGTA